MNYERSITRDIFEFFKKPVPIFQVLIGPRQVGKTTAAYQIIEKLGWPSHYASAEAPLPLGAEWINTQWRIAEMKASESSEPVLLVLDELQKVNGWSEALKKLWDSAKQKGNIKLLVLGSSALLLQKGLTESLAGRFFLHRFTHWSYKECKDAFGWNLNQWLFFGGYPGTAPFVDQEEIWKQYVANSLVETVLAKDVMQMQTVTKPALLRHLFALAAGYPAQILSYNKMLGQLQDVGNTTTLAHYLKLLESAFLISGLECFSQGKVKRKASSPKLILWNNALINAISTYSFHDAIRDTNWYGRLVENAVGAHLLNHLLPLECDVTYWRESEAKSEMDFVISNPNEIYGLEVKSGKTKPRFNLDPFKNRYPSAKILIIGDGGIDLENFFLTHPKEWLKIKS